MTLKVDEENGEVSLVSPQAAFFLFRLQSLCIEMERGVEAVWTLLARLDFHSVGAGGRHCVFLRW